MNYNEFTTKELILKAIKENVVVYKEDNYSVTILTEDESEIVLFQIRFKDSFHIDLLLSLGLAKYNPNIAVNNEGHIMATFYITKIQ